MLEFEVKDLKFEGGVSILGWEYIQLENYKDCFVFYDRYETSETSGFRFLSFQVIGFQPDKPILDPANIAEILYWGYAYFDGIRHLYLGREETENYGYINYPNLKMHVKILETLRELEVKYCSKEDLCHG